jgi:hypothetical protein
VKRLKEALAPEVRPYCEIAIDRLNLARRRLSPGDKAIDGSICHEALLAYDSNQEITHRLSLRSALLLSTEFKERQEISNAVKKFYKLRSDSVHGNALKPKDAQRNADCAECGLDICAQVLRKIVSLNKKFDPSWDLSGSQPK